MRILLDEGLPRSAAALLRADGHECVHVAEIGLRGAPDVQILLYALENTFLIVSLDADFHSQLAITNASAPSVIRIRIDGLKALETKQLIADVLRRFAAELSLGVAVSVGRSSVRIHKLPFGDH